MSTRLEHVFNYVAKAVWAIEPSVLAVITDLVAARMDGQRLSEEEILARIGHDPVERQFELEQRNARMMELARGSARGGGRAGQAVALLSLYGIIAPRASMVNNLSGPAGTGMDEFSKQLDVAVADPDIGAIVIDVNSPGGTADMLLETGAKLRAARDEKPIYMVANTIAYSAAYWLMSQGSELAATPSGGVGSIGVYLAHQDLSAKLEAEGRKVTLISAGKYKTEANPFQALSDDAKAELQRSVDEVYVDFVNEVARGRGVTTKVVRDEFGEGRTVSAKRALSVGMIDRIDTLEGVVRRALRAGGRTASRGRAEHFAGAPTADASSTDVTSFGDGSPWLESLDDVDEPEASSEAIPTVPDVNEPEHDAMTELAHLQYLNL